jgi:hypothetical protein
MKRPLFLNRRLYEMDKFQQNLYLYNKINSAKPQINTNINFFNSQKDLIRGLPKLKRIFIII